MWKCQNCQAENQTLTSRTTTGSLDHWTVNCLWAVTALLLSTVPGHRISSEKGKLYSTQPPCHGSTASPNAWALQLGPATALLPPGEQKPFQAQAIPKFPGSAVGWPRDHSYPDRPQAPNHPSQLTGSTGP